MEAMTPIADTDTAHTSSEDLAAQVLAALRQAVPPATVRERFGLSSEQFGEIIRQHNQKIIALLECWDVEDAAGIDEKDVDIDKLLRDNSLSLREFSVE